MSSHILGNVSLVWSMISHFSSIPNMHSLEPQAFGCVAFVHTPKQHPTKFESRAVRHVFPSYPPNKRSYNCHRPCGRRLLYIDDIDISDSDHHALLR